MDKIRRRGWWRDKEGWWTTDKDGEETLFRRSDDQDELEMVDFLEDAANVLDYGMDRKRSRIHDTKLAKVLQTSENPVPFLDSDVSIGSHEGNVVTKSVLEAIASNKLPRLTSLDLKDVDMDHEDFEILAAAAESGYLSALRILRLKSCCAASGHIALAKAMKSGHVLALEELELCGTVLALTGAAKHDMGDTGCEAYADAISAGKLPSLAKINFCFNSIRSSGIQALGRAIMRLRELKYLNLSGNDIGDEGLKAPVNSSKVSELKYLDLSFNRIGDEGLKTLVDSFQVGELTHLDLRHNLIGDEGLKTLVDSFQAAGDGLLPNLQYLNLSGNPCTEVGLLYLAKAVSSGRLNSLKTLHLDFLHSSITEDGAAALVSALSNLKYLTQAYFGSYKFPALSRLLDQHLEHNRTLKGHEGSPVVPAGFSRVYICGDPEVGKTTLRKAVGRSFWESLCAWGQDLMWKHGQEG